MLYLGASRQSTESRQSFFPPGSFTAALGLFRHAGEEKRSAGELIGRLPTLPQRKIRDGTGPDFLERAKISFDGSNLPGSAQNLFRPPESFWIRLRLFPAPPSFLEPS